MLTDDVKQTLHSSSQTVEPQSADSSTTVTPPAKARTAGDIMSRRFLTAREDTPAVFVLGLLSRNHFTGIPIVDEHGRLVGMVTDYRLITEHWRNDPECTGLTTMRAADMMEAPPCMVDEATPLAEVAELLQERSVGSVPVVRDGKVVGIVSRRKLLEVLTQEVIARCNWC